MADLSKIKLNGTTYNFKDAEARSKLPHVVFTDVDENDNIILDTSYSQINT